MKQQTTSQRVAPTASEPAGRATVLVGAATFLAGFVGVILAGRALSSDRLPLPGAPAAEAAVYFRTNADVSLAIGLLHAVSALGLAVFLLAVLRRPAAGRAARLLGVLAALVVTSLVLSAGISVVLAVVARTVSPEAIAALQQVSFVLGGVVHVVLLGVVVGLVSRALVWSRPIRVFGAVAAVPAVLSALSVVVLAASVLLPVGRVLCMLWAVSAGISVLRGHSLRNGPPA